ncbi:MAG: hypothetical protein VW127_01935 [Flavobacteriaceae bacterium]|jgi:hypothetical protein
MVNKIILLGVITVLIAMTYWFKINKDIEESDACLCTEILSNEKFLDNKSKMPSVKRCIDSFDDFENAHLECIKMFQFDHPEIKQDSLKSA